MDPAKLTRKHYEAMGRVIVNWAKIECGMPGALATITGMHSGDALVAFWHMDFAGQKDRFFTLLESLEPPPDLDKAAETLSKRLDSAYEVRNLVAHSIWSKGEARGAIYPWELRAKNGSIKWTHKGLHPREFTPARFITESDTILRLRTDFKEFLAQRIAPFVKTKSKARLRKKAKKAANSA